MFNFRKKEKYLLLDVSSDKISGLLISLDDQKNVKKEKSWENLEKRQVSKNTPFIPNVSKVIAACDPELAFKIFIILSMERESSSEPVGRVELENLLAQAVSKIFNHYRREASSVLGADELDTILVDSSVSGFEVDGHKVINPLGFNPQKINAVVEMTFAARKTFERVRAIRKKGNVFFTEKGQSQASSVKKAAVKQADFLRIGRDKSHFYPGQGSGPFYGRNEIDWSSKDFVSEISKNWSLGEDAAAGIYDYYVNEGVSRPLEKYLLKIFSKPARELVGYVKKLKTSGKIHVTGNVPLGLIGKNPFYEMPLKNFAAKSGFNFTKSDFKNEQEIFNQLAPFFEFYYDNSDNEINGWLKRRLNWLGSSV